MPQFTAGELETMKILWTHGELKPAEIQKHYSKPIKNPALRSYLSILLEKGHITRTLVGKAYYYKAKTRQKSAFQKMLGELVDNFCEGSSETLLVNLLKKEKLTEKELLHIKELADKNSNSPSGRNK